jgi:hypothetical protein
VSQSSFPWIRRRLRGEVENLSHKVKRMRFSGKCIVFGQCVGLIPECHRVNRYWFDVWIVSFCPFFLQPGLIVRSGLHKSFERADMLKSITPALLEIDIHESDAADTRCFASPSAAEKGVE